MMYIERDGPGEKSLVVKRQRPLSGRVEKLKPFSDNTCWSSSIGKAVLGMERKRREEWGEKGRECRAWGFLETAR